MMMLVYNIVLVGIIARVDAQGFQLAPPLAGLLLGGQDLSCSPRNDPSHGLKRLNEACNSTSQCLNGGTSVVCGSGGVCQCAPGFHKSKGTRLPPPLQPLFGQFSSAEDTICRPLPTLGQSCSTACQPPLQCIDQTDRTDKMDKPSGHQRRLADSEEEPDEEVGDTWRTSSQSDFVQLYGLNRWSTSGWSSVTITTCQCLPPYKIVHFRCQLECNGTEINGEDGKCYKKCLDNEVQTEDYQCWQRASLGESCKVDRQCSSAFSSCVNNVCQCLHGFSKYGYTCIAQAMHCEFGEPLRETNYANGSKLASCSLRVPAALGPIPVGPQGSVWFAGVMGVSSFGNQQGDQSNGCPAEYYCQPYDSPGPTGSVPGMCCPTPKPRCPVGEPHPTANCSTLIGLGLDANSCPSKTHYCYQRPGVAAAVCCPRPCPDGLVLANGLCSPVAQIGHKCSANEQCTNDAMCIEGICACPNKTKLMNRNGGSKFCVASCDRSTEVTFNNKCYTRLRLGDVCNGEGYRCPSSAYCSTTGLCQCACGTVRVNDSLCAPPPTCPSSRPVTSHPHRSQRQYDTFDNATLCQIEGRKAPNDRAVPVCPSDRLCLPYLQDMGVCCPKPEPFCPNGEPPSGACQPTNEGDCGEDSFCFKYFTVDVSYRNPIEGHICCSKRTQGYNPALIGGLLFPGDLDDQNADQQKK